MKTTSIVINSFNFDHDPTPDSVMHHANYGQTPFKTKDQGR